MRKLIVCNMISLDGYYAGRGGDARVLPMDEAFDAYNAERLRAADKLLLGRVTYEMFKGFWPALANDSFATPTNREISRLNGAIDKVVISDSIAAPTVEPWRNTRVIRRADAHQQIAELKRQSGKDILVFGSHILWNALLANGLVDELHLWIGQVVLGEGTPAFERPIAASLRLIDTRTREGSENVLVRYQVAPNKA